MNDPSSTRSRRKTLVYANTGLSSKQVGLTGELLMRLKHINSDVALVFCDNVLDNCYFNRTHNTLACASCQARQTQIAVLSEIDCRASFTLKRFPIAYNVDLPEFADLDELLDYRFEDVQIGRGVASSIISYTRDYQISTHRYGALIDLEMRKAINVLLNFREIVHSYSPDEIYIFNGRFAEVWPVVDLATNLGIPFYTLEAGAGTNYEIFENNLPHSISVRHRHILRYWENADTAERERIGHDWFVTRRRGSEEYEQSFTKQQHEKLLPKGFNADSKNIAICNSSEDELKAIMEWQTDLFKNQNEAIREIIGHYTKRSAFHFYIRVHPNLGKVDNQQIREIAQMNFENATIIAPQDPVDTYALMMACDAVITFGSSTGIEATYWGKPSILFGRSFYVYLNCTYNPQSYEELYTLLENHTLDAKPQALTLPYGHYMGVYGQKSKHFSLAGKSQSRFRGHRLRIFSLKTIPFLQRFAGNFRQWISTHNIYTGRRFSIKDIFTYK